MGVGRPPLSVRTMGKIRLYKVSTGYRARALFRDPDGRTRGIERTGSGKGAATRALKEAVRDRVHLDGLLLTSTTKSTARLRTLALPTRCVETPLPRGCTAQRLPNRVGVCHSQTPVGVHHVVWNVHVVDEVGTPGAVTIFVVVEPAHLAQDEGCEAS